MAIIPRVTKATPQVTQLELLMPAPLLVDHQVEFREDLKTLKVEYNYPHKVVWVMAEACYYYLLIGCSGASDSDWKKMGYTATINVWSSNENYLKGDVVFADGKLWTALLDVPKGYDPPSYPLYWQCIAGEAVTEVKIFTNENNFLVNTSIKNPTFWAEIGIFQMSGNNYVYDQRHLPTILNMKLAYPEVVYRNDLPPVNGGFQYEVKFYTNDSTSQNFTGLLFVK